MPAVTELVSLLEAREYVGAGEGDLARLEQVVDAAASFVTRELGDEVLSSDYVEMLDGSGTNELTLRHGPITAVTQLEIIRTISPVAWDTVSLASYPVVVVTPGRRKIAFRNRVFDCGIQNWQATYTAGYGDADGVMSLPDDLAELAKQVVMVLWKAPERIASMIASISTGGPNASTVTYVKQALPDWADRTIELYRRKRWR